MVEIIGQLGVAFVAGLAAGIAAGMIRRIRDVV